MMEDNNKLVYFENWAYEYREIESKYVESIDTILKYFGGHDIDDKLDGNGEFIIYKLVPYVRIKKDVVYTLKNNFKDE